VAVGVGRPGAHRDGTAAVAALRQRRDDDGEGGELLGRRLSFDDPQQRRS
jgi:hypothetical protein